MPITAAAIGSVLKEAYSDDLTEFFNSTSPTSAQFMSDFESLDMDGKRAYFVVDAALGGGVAFGNADTGTLPPTSLVTETNGGVPLRDLLARTQISWRGQRQGQKAGAIVKVVTRTMDKLKMETGLEKERSLWAEASDGSIALCGVTAGSTTIVLDAAVTAAQIRSLWVNTYIDIGATAATLAYTGRRITAVSATTPGSYTITIADGGPVVTTAGTDYIWLHQRAGTLGTTGLPDDGQYAMTSIPTIVKATGNIFGLSTSTYPSWAAPVTAVGGIFRPTVVDNAIMNVGVDAGEDIDQLWASKGVFQAIQAYYEGRQRTLEWTTLNGGQRAVKWSSVPEGSTTANPGVSLAYGRFVPDSSMFGLCTKTFTIYGDGDGWQWRHPDNPLQDVPGQVYSEASAYERTELGCVKRNANFRLSTITEA